MAVAYRDIEGQVPLVLEGHAHERSPLLHDTSGSSSDSSISVSTTRSNVPEEPENIKVAEAQQKNNVGAVISLLLIGVFISNIDGSLVIATAGIISSHFSQLEAASWLLTSFALASCAAQPVLAKLSDIFGRKSVLLVCYVLFALGNLITGAGQELWHVIAGRTVAGLGGAGMNVLVSILITDLVPKVEVAAWRSYVNVAATVGRSLGGPLGGWLADSVGWRWSFIGQAPLTAVAFLVVAWKLVNPSVPHQTPPESQRMRSKLRKIDYLGSVLISATIITFILAVDMPSRGTSWTSPVVISLLAASVLLGILFLVFEQKYASEPIFPPRLLLERNVGSSYSINGLQTAAQISMMFSVPLYFQVTSEASNTEAGTRLVPAVIGNTVGGLATGFIIKKTGKYKALLWLAALSACCCYGVLILTWHGQTSPLASLTIFPGGFGTGIAGAATFVVLTSYLPHEDVAVATGGLYLSSSIGMILGLSLSSSLQQAMLRSVLSKRDVNPKVIRHLLGDVLYIRKLKGDLKKDVIQSYVESLEYNHGLSFIWSAATLLISFTVWEGNLI